jgi:hypothetical protein
MVEVVGSGGVENSGAWSYKWKGLEAGDTAGATSHVITPDASIQVSGEFDGATVTIKGSNDGSVWFTLNDTRGVALTFAAAGLRQVLEVCKFLKPELAGGGASTDLNVTIVAVR